jgi:hypothetical protein
MSGTPVNRFEDSLAFLDDVMPLQVSALPGSNQPGPSRQPPTHPLKQLEDDLARWCHQHGKS